MTLERDKKILDLITRLTGDVKVAREYSLGHTAELLQMATLQLQMILHEISDDELRALACALERVAAPESPTEFH